MTFNETRFYDLNNHFKQLDVAEPPSLQLPKHVESESDEEEVRRHIPRRQEDPQGNDDTEGEIGSTIEVAIGNREESVEQQSHDQAPVSEAHSHRKSHRKTMAAKLPKDQLYADQHEGASQLKRAKNSSDPVSSQESARKCTGATF